MRKNGLHMLPLAELSDQKLPNLYSAPFGNTNCPELYSQNSFKGISRKSKNNICFLRKSSPRRIIDALEWTPYASFCGIFRPEITESSFSTFWTGRIAQNSILKIVLHSFPRKPKIGNVFSPKIRPENHKSCVRMDSICEIRGKSETRKLRTVILHLLERTDCPKLYLKNSFKGILPKI